MQFSKNKLQSSNQVVSSNITRDYKTIVRQKGITCFFFWNLRKFSTTLKDEDVTSVVCNFSTKMLVLERINKKILCFHS